MLKKFIVKIMEIYKWCNQLGDFIESGEGVCGNCCKDYYPCNGRSGRCRNLRNGFIETGKYFVLTEKGLVFVKVRKE